MATENSCSPHAAVCSVRVLYSVRYTDRASRSSCTVNRTGNDVQYVTVLCRALQHCVLSSAALHCPLTATEHSLQSARMRTREKCITPPQDDEHPEAAPFGPMSTRVTPLAICRCCSGTKSYDSVTSGHETATRQNTPPRNGHPSRNAPNLLEAQNNSRVGPCLLTFSVSSILSKSKHSSGVNCFSNFKINFYD